MNGIRHYTFGTYWRGYKRMAYSTLVNTETLARNLNFRWCLFDCRFVLADPTAGERAYAEGHIPGAQYLHLDRDLADPVTPEAV